MAEDPAVADLVVRAQKGDQDAWSQLTRRYAPFLWVICSRYRLSREDTYDVGQTVWLRVVEKLGTLQRPEAFSGWLGTITQRECLRVVRAVRKREDSERILDFEREMSDESVMIGQELERAERQAAIRAAFAQLPTHCRQLLLLLIQDDSLSYADIAERLCVPVGGIGPTRRRCLDRLKGLLGPLSDDDPGSGGDA